MSDVDLHLFPNPLARDRAGKARALADGCVVGLPYFTVEEFIDQCLEEIGEYRPLVGGGLRRLLVGRSVRRAVAGTPSPGLVEEYAQAIAELKEGGIEPDMLSAVSSKGGQGSGLRLLAAVYQDYEEQLQASGVQDREGLDFSLLKWFMKNPNGPFPEVLSALRSVTLHDLFSHSPVVCSVLSRFIETAPEGGVVVSFTSSANVDATRFAEYTWQRFVEDERLADHVLPEFARPRLRGGNLEAVAERLFRGGPVARELTADGSLLVLQGRGRYEEVEEIGWQIRRLLDGGVPMTEIAVLIRNWDLYGEFVEDVLQRYRIPGHFRLGRPLFSVPLVKILFSFLQVAERAWRREDFLSLLTSEYFRGPGEEWVDVEGILNRVRYIDAELAPLDRLLGRPPEGSFRMNEGEAAKILRSRVRKMLRVHKRMVSQDRTFLGHLEALKKALDGLNVFSRLDLVEGTPIGIAQREQEAIRLFLETLQQAGVLLERIEGGKHPFSEFVSLAVDLLQDRTLPAAQSWTEGIAILGLRDVVGLRYQAVFIPGLVDGEFPKPYRENPVFPDNERVALNSMLKRGPLRERLPASGLPLLTSKDRGREEPLLFFAALESCDRQGMLSYPGQDQEGEPVFPSAFIDEVLWHFRLEPGADPRLTSRRGIIKTADACLSRGELVRASAREWPRGGWPALDAFLEREGIPVARLKESALVEEIRGRYLAGATTSERPEFYGDLEPVAGGVPSGTAWTPTALEAMASCPFAFFAQFSLRLQPREAPGRDLDSRELGSLVHEILRKLYGRWKGGDDAGFREVLQDSAREVIRGWEKRGGGGDPGYWRLRCREVCAALEDYARYLFSENDESDWKTLWLEETLGPRSLGADHSVVLSGRADRVTTREENGVVASIRVEDFKYSASTLTYKSLAKEEAVGLTSFQLPVYALLARERLREEGARLLRGVSLSGRYVLLREPGRKFQEIRLAKEVLDPGGSPLFRGIGTLVDKAGRGQFHPDPLELNGCDFCSYRALCRFWSSGAGEAVTLLRREGGEDDGD